MQRSFDPEVLDGDTAPAELVERAHRGLSLTHRLLGNHAAIIRALTRNPFPIRRVLDVGCGHGGLLLHVERRLGVEGVGMDLRPIRSSASPRPILRGDAVRDPLPVADVAVSVYLAHHLSDDQLAALILNVGRSCRRFVILDLVRHHLPLALFRTFAPLFLPGVNISDGCLSIRRAYTPGEFRALIGRALAGTGAAFSHTVAPLYIRQVADITYPSRG